MSLHGTLLSTSEGSLGSNAQSCSVRPQVSDNENPLEGDCLVIIRNVCSWTIVSNVLGE